MSKYSTNVKKNIKNNKNHKWISIIKLGWYKWDI